MLALYPLDSTGTALLPALYYSGRLVAVVAAALELEAAALEVVALELAPALGVVAVLELVAALEQVAVFAHHPTDHH